MFGQSVFAGRLSNTVSFLFLKSETNVCERRPNLSTGRVEVQRIFESTQWNNKEVSRINYYKSIRKKKKIIIIQARTYNNQNKKEKNLDSERILYIINERSGLFIIILQSLTFWNSTILKSSMIEVFLPKQLLENKWTIFPSFTIASLARNDFLLTFHFHEKILKNHSHSYMLIETFQM